MSTSSGETPGSSIVTMNFSSVSFTSRAGAHAPRVVSPPFPPDVRPNNRFISFWILMRSRNGSHRVIAMYLCTSFVHNLALDDVLAARGPFLLASAAGGGLLLRVHGLAYLLEGLHQRLRC